MKKEFVFKRYNPQYKKQVIDLLDGLWHFDREEKLRYFKWKYEDNPFTDDVAGFIALDGEKVVAFRGYMVQPMRMGNMDFLNAQLADTVTDSNYRRMGLFRSITQFSINELEKDRRFGVSLNSSSGGPTLNGYLKLDWRPLSEREHLFRISFNGLVRRFIRRVRPFEEAEEKKSNLSFILSKENRPKEISSLPFDYSRISHSHTTEYYDWRMRNPHNKFVYAYLYRDEALTAYYILVDLGGGRYDIVDFNGTDKKSLRQLLDFFCRKTAPLYISLWTVGKTNVIYQNRSAFGFLPLNAVLRHLRNFKKPPFLVRGFNDRGVDIYEENAWNINKIIADEV